MDDPLDVDPIVLVEKMSSPKSIQGVKRKTTTPSSTNKKPKKMTPEQLEARRLREEEKAKREEEKARKEEEKKRKQEERRREQEERNEQKRLQELERLKMAEERKKAAEDKKRQQEEQQKLKMEEKAKRDEEKKVKEDERLKKLEDKRRLQEEKQRQEDEKRKQIEVQEEKKRRQSAFMLNFVKKSTEVDKENKAPQSDLTVCQTSTTSVISNESVGPFLPFQLKPDQSLANPIPSCIRDNFNVAAFDCDVQYQDESKQLYLDEIKKRDTFRVGRKYRLKAKKTSNDNDIQILELNSQSMIKDDIPKFKVKFLSFHENCRPPYFGTYNKRSRQVTGRRPFGQEVKWLNYEIDSDEEWDEGGPGESLKGSDDEAGDPEDDYDIDNDFMVPHGYLSDEEAAREEEDDLKMGKDGNFREKEMITRKNMKVKLLKPVSIGCLWSKEMKQPEFKSAAQILIRFRMIFNGAVDVTLPRPASEKKKRVRKPKVPKEVKTPKTPKVPAWVSSLLVDVMLFIK